MSKILPGDLISSCEEFAASGESVFEENGFVYANVLGELLIDSSKRVASVSSVKRVRMLSKGNLVYGIVKDLFEQIALVSFVPVDDGVGCPDSSGFLRISEIKQNGFVERFRDNIAIGDVLKARVLEVSPLGVYFTIAQPDLGVVTAFCSSCRNKLVYSGKQFECRKCGSKEFRKNVLTRS